MKALLDHIVIGANQLGCAASMLEAKLGVDFAGGGTHQVMATHNRVMRLGDDSYLEVIAADPAATASRPRWFSLDDPATRTKLNAAPCPLCWVVSVPDVQDALAQCGYDAGEVIDMSRGDLRWKLSVPADGGLAEGGVLPVLIEWPNGRNPADRMPLSPLQLDRIALTHPDPDWIIGCLDRLGLSGLAGVTKGRPALAFHLTRGDSVIVLS